MDLLDGGSDLSDLSDSYLSDAAPPTPGPVETPEASPVHRSAARTDATENSSKSARSTRANRRAEPVASSKSDVSKPATRVVLKKTGKPVNAKTDKQHPLRKGSRVATDAPPASKAGQANAAPTESVGQDTQQDAAPEDGVVVRSDPNARKGRAIVPKATTKRARSGKPAASSSASPSGTPVRQSKYKDDDDEEEGDDDQIQAPQRKRKRLAAEIALPDDEDSDDFDSLDEGLDDDDEHVSERGKPSKAVTDGKHSTDSAKSIKPGGKIKATFGKDKTSAGKSSSEAKMRATIDAAKDKTLKGAAAAAKLDPKASSFKPKVPGTASTTPLSGVKPATSSGASKKGPQAFGKSMSGWDQLFGAASGLSSAASTPPPKSSATKPAPAPTATAVPVSGIRPDPLLEGASHAEIAQMRAAQNADHLKTDQCFDLLAHAEIMLAFEHDAIYKDRKSASLYRPSRFGAGNLRA